MPHESNSNQKNMSTIGKMNPNRIARIAGLLYVLMIPLGLL
jgi:hypothetical protein